MLAYLWNRGTKTEKWNRVTTKFFNCLLYINIKVTYKITTSARAVHFTEPAVLQPIFSIQPQAFQSSGNIPLASLDL